MRLESLIPEERHATLSVSVNAEGPTDDDIPAMLRRAGFKIRSWDVISRRGDAAPLRKVRCEVSWRGRRDDILTPPIVNQIAQIPGVTRLRWEA